MSFPQGIYFRATDNQTDPTNYDAEVSAAVNYPRTTAQGNTVGWEAAIGAIFTRDRTGPTDVRLKGVHGTANSAPADYRIDLPATGNYNIRLAMGDAGFAEACRARFLDTSTQFQDIDANVSAAHWLDATGVDRAGEAAWVSDNAPLARTFTSTIFRARFGQSVNNASSNSAVAALYIEAAAGGNTTISLSSVTWSSSTNNVARNYQFHASGATHQWSSNDVSIGASTNVALAGSAWQWTTNVIKQNFQFNLSGATHLWSASSIVPQTAINLASSSWQWTTNAITKTVNFKPFLDPATWQWTGRAFVAFTVPYHLIRALTRPLYRAIVKKITRNNT